MINSRVDQARLGQTRLDKARLGLMNMLAVA